MKGRGGNGVGGAPADLLVCFPSRAHLALMPKPICSPSRSTEHPKRHYTRPTTRGGQASPLFKTKGRNATSRSGGGDGGADVISEPTSPKVTCAGQIKVSRPKPRPTAAAAAATGGGAKSWLTVMEEMEELRRRRQRGRGKRPHWLDALGLKKEAMHFLHAFRGLRLHMSCFGSFHAPRGCTSDEDDDDSAAAGEEEEEREEEEKSRTVFSKWFMLLEENRPGHDSPKKKVDEEGDDEVEEEEEDEDEEEEETDGAFEGCLVTPTSPSTSSSAPPPNALLLMRCRSAPAKEWKLEGDDDGGGEQVTAGKLKEEEKEKERLVLMSYAPDFFKVSPDIAKETWVVGAFDPLARSRSWRR